MRGWRSLWRSRFGRRIGSLAGNLAVAILIGGAGVSLAQDSPPPAFLTIDQERLFLESEFGEALVAREQAMAQELDAENVRIEGELIAEEQALTVRRATLPAEEFSALAAAFDEKVVRIRAEQDAKLRALTRSREGDRNAFFRAAVPVLRDLLVERKALAIIDKSAIILSLSAIDVTDAAIAKVNVALRDMVNGQVQPPAPDPAPADATSVVPAPPP
jgi:Skp family chaperone for outer membrane proteins